MVSVKKPRLQTTSSDYRFTISTVKLKKVQSDMTKSIFYGLHEHVHKGGWLFNKLKRDIFKANVIKLCCFDTVYHPEGIYHVTGVESVASLEAFPQTAPGNQAATHIWVAPYTNGTALKDEGLARKKQ